LDSNTNALIEQRAEVFKALGHPIRLALVEALRDGDRCVCDIARAVGAERSNVSRHLAVLVRAGVLDSRKTGLEVRYRLKTPCVLDSFACIEGILCERLEDSRRALRQLARSR